MTAEHDHEPHHVSLVQLNAVPVMRSCMCYRVHYERLGDHTSWIRLQRCGDTHLTLFQCESEPSACNMVRCTRTANDG